MYTYNILLKFLPFIPDAKTLIAHFNTGWRAKQIKWDHFLKAYQVSLKKLLDRDSSISSPSSRAVLFLALIHYLHTN